MAKRESNRQAEPVYTDGVGKLRHSAHHHIAEVYGEAEARGLRPWARRRVLARIGSQGTQ